MTKITDDFAKLISDMERRISELELVAVRDPLTGALNRRGFEDAWRREKSRAIRSKSSLIIAYIDLDHFKTINDTYGHEGGDRVLVMFADTTLAMTRSEDILGRYGGEEFTLLMPGLTMDEARDVLLRIRHGMQKWKTFKATFSAGLALVTEDDTLETAANRADAAMYRAKNHGRDQILTETEHPGALN